MRRYTLRYFRFMLVAFIAFFPLSLYAVGPSITSLTPNSGAVGASITIAGSSFGSTQGTSTVKFNGTTATSITSWGASSIVAAVPASATTGTVVVTVSGKASNGVSFTVVPAPAVSGVSPTSGAVGASITISGSNFGSTQGSGTVSFNGTSASPTSWNATTIVVPVPSGATSGNVIVHASGVNSNGVPFSVTPFITNLSANSGAVGAPITLTGSTFGSSQGTSTVKFNGTIATVSSWGSSSIVVTVPSGATTGNVIVTVNGFPSNGMAFTVVPPPSISGISPASAAVGNSVTINGNGFGSPQGSGTVSFNGTSAAPSSWSATAIVVPVPSGATTGNVVVNASGVSSNGSPFTVLPQIANLSATSGAIGTPITISGTSFGSTQGTSTVTFNGVAGTPTSWATSSIVVPVPNGASSGNVVVTVAGQNSNGVSFVVLLPGTTYYFHQTSAGTGYDLISTAGPTTPSATLSTGDLKNTTGNTWIANWASAVGTPGIVGAVPANSTFQFSLWMSKSVSFGTIFPVVTVGKLDSNQNTTAWVTAVSTTALTTTLTKITYSFTLTSQQNISSTDRWWVEVGANIPSGGSTTHSVTASFAFDGTLGGNYGSSGVIPAILPSPVISSLSPSSGVAGMTISIAGSSFGASQGSGSVTFNYQPASISSWSGTTINAVVPGNVSGGDVIVRSSNGQSSNALPFTLLVPVISNVSATTGPVGSSVTITGSNFGLIQGSSVVTFNGVNATINSWSNNQIVALVPSGATTGYMFVVTGQGNDASNPITFTVIPAPTITALSPSGGPVNTSVTVSGTTFGMPQGTGSIKFNGIAGVPTSWSANSIIVPVPAGATTGPVVVTGPGGSSNGLTFTVSGAPNIAQLSPSSGAPGTAVNITGSNFGLAQGSSVVRFNGRAAAVTSWGTGSIQATAPVGLTTGPVTVTVSGQASNGLTFTAVTSGTLAGTVSNASGGGGISGATVQALQNGIVKSSASTAGDGTYSINNLIAGNYDVQVSASSFGTALKNTASITAGQTTTVNLSLSTPSTVSGTVTQADGTTSIPGASVQLFAGSAAGSKTTADSNGNYSIGSLNAASYTLQASATGFVTKSQSATLAGGTTTTANFALQATGVNPINYAYDELGRLISVTDTSGDTAVYHYDAVGNILSISRYSSTQVSIVSFTPRTGPVGTAVVINGTAFSTTPSQDTVQFNGVAATVTSATATQISATVPPGATTGPITVTTPNGSAVSASNYTVGPAAGAPTITGFQPASATIGSTIAILGTNFYAAPNNKLTLNTSRPYATSGTSTQINTAIPASTTSGRISVTTPDGTATSTQDLYIPFGSHQASDIGFTARFAFGNSQSVSLSANKIALLLFDASAGQGASLQLSGSTFASCTLYIFAPNGAQLTSSGCTSATTLVSSSGLPSTGTYTIGIDPGSSAGSLSVTLNGDFVSTITVPGPGQTGSVVRVPASGDLLTGQYGRLTFNGTAGQKVSINVLTSTIGSTFNSCFLTLYSPTNTQIVWQYCGSTGNFFLDTVTLPTTGQYSLVVAPQGTATGNVSVSINNDADVTGTINIDGSTVTTVTTVAGQDARLSFSASPGQRIVLYATNVSNSFATLYLVRPDGSNQTSLYFNTINGVNAFYLDTQTLATGTYQLWVAHSNTYIGSQTLQIASVPADFTFATSVPPAGQTGPTIRVPSSGDLTAGQNATITFSGTVGQSVSFNVLPSTIGSTFNGCFVTLYDPNGNNLGIGSSGTPYCGSPGNFFMGPVTLGVNGTYTLVMDPVNAATGNVSVSMNNDATATGTISIGGPAVTIATTAAGQDAQLSFSATAGQRIVLFATNVTNANATAQLVKPDGTNQASVGFGNNPSGQTYYLDTQTLTTTGTYLLWVQHYGALNSFGSQTLQIPSVPSDVSGSVTVGGAAYSFTTVAGQNANITVSNPQSQSLTVHLTNGTYPSQAGLCDMFVTGPSPSTNQVGFTYCDGATGTINLGTQPAGTYNMFVDPQQQSAGGLSVNVTTP